FSKSHRIVCGAAAAARTDDAIIYCPLPLPPSKMSAIVLALANDAKSPEILVTAEGVGISRSGRLMLLRGTGRRGRRPGQKEGRATGVEAGAAEEEEPEMDEDSTSARIFASPSAAPGTIPAPSASGGGGGGGVTGPAAGAVGIARAPWASSSASTEGAPDACAARFAGPPWASSPASTGGPPGACAARFAGPPSAAFSSAATGGAGGRGRAAP
ncbi:unnamed protein product, partial [Ectocarpus sp. 12 AP-2014]